MKNKVQEQRPVVEHVSRKEVGEMCTLADEAYMDNTAEHVFAQSLGPVQFLNDEETDTQLLYIESKDRGLFLVYRGTSSLTDAITDIKLRRVKYDPENWPKLTVHRGFKGAWDGARKMLEDKLKTYMETHPDAQVTNVGHSLGGALATLSAFYVATTYPQARVRAVTFGSPRVGNPAFKKAYSDYVPCTSRVFDKADPVAKVPPRITMAYRHVKAKEYKVRDPENRRAWCLGIQVSSHFLDNYKNIFKKTPEEVNLGVKKELKRQATMEKKRLKEEAKAAKKAAKSNGKGNQAAPAATTVPEPATTVDDLEVIELEEETTAEAEGETGDAAP